MTKADASDTGPMVRRPIALNWDEGAPDYRLRDTGIAPIGRIPWGTHICMFCKTRQDVLDALGAYFAPAREANEYCVWVYSDPLTEEDARKGLREFLPDQGRAEQKERFEIVRAEDWYYDNGRFDLSKAIAGWHRRVDDALAKGFDGVRACGNPLWRDMEQWRSIAEYEHELDSTLGDRPIILLCTYMEEKSRPEDIFDVAHSHQCVIARRSGRWDFLTAPGNARAQQEIKLLNGDLDILPQRTTGETALTQRERVVLAQIARGASSKEAARTLGISPRTVDFHRGNMMRKFGAKNAADLVHKALNRN